MTPPSEFAGKQIRFSGLPIDPLGLGDPKRENIYKKLRKYVTDTGYGNHHSTLDVEMHPDDWALAVKMGFIDTDLPKLPKPRNMRIVSREYWESLQERIMIKLGENHNLSIGNSEDLGLMNSFLEAFGDTHFMIMD